MIEITALGMGMLMSAVAVAVGGLTLNATLLILGRTLQARPLGTSFEPAAIHLSQAEAIDELNV